MIETRLRHMFDRFQRGLEKNDPVIVEEVRSHLLKYVETGNAIYLTVLVKAMRDERGL